MDRLSHLLQQQLVAMPTVRRYHVAFSGGADSAALLGALAALRERDALPGGAELQAIHVDHRLHPDAPAWADHCRQVAERLGVTLRVVVVDAVAAPGESPEAAARRARYRALSEGLGPDEAVLTAHHRDDQAETLLLQLLRGSGPRGLAAMAPVAPLGDGWLLRPLLGVERSALQGWLQAHHTAWLDDPSNADPRFDRNYLRHHVLPALQQRWPAATKTLERAAAHQAEAAELLDDLAAGDLAQAGVEAGAPLPQTVVLALPPARQRNLLRFWLRSCGLRPPGQARLQTLLTQIACSGDTAAPALHWPGGEVRCYRGRLYAGPPLPQPPAPGLSLPWDGVSPLPLPDGRRLIAEPTATGGLDPRHLRGGALTLRFRGGGEQLCPAGHRHRRPLKKLLAEAGVPPWQRPFVPLLYVGDALAAVAGHWVAAPFAARGEGIAIRAAKSRPDGI